MKHITGSRWFLLFVDDHTRLSWVFIMKEKSETSSIFKSFHAMIKTQFSTNIQIFRTDRAKYFFNTAYQPTKGIVHESSCVDTPQQNGVSESKKCHLLEVARSLLFTRNVFHHYWGDAILTATYLINIMPSRVLNFKTPIQILLQSTPILAYSIAFHCAFLFCTYSFPTSGQA